MAKKKIISDFRDLKGKVSFSEKTSVGKMSPKIQPAASPKPKESDDGLRVGQSVVLMDSDIRGRIVGLGKTVRIELEDGLVIEAIPEGRNVPKGQQLQFQMAPQQRKAKQRKILIFNENRDFFYFLTKRKKVRFTTAFGGASTHHHRYYA